MALPQTAFESNGHTRWTTVAQELTYFNQLLAEVPSITEEITGESPDGNPMRWYKIGSGDTKVMFVCQQHGNEVAGREAAMTLIRDWATSTDPDIVDYLQRVEMVIMPTACPDSITEREGNRPFGISRSHIRVDLPDSTAIQRGLTAHEPVILIDWHEGRNITNNCGTSKVLNNNIHPDLTELSEKVEQHVKNMHESNGNTWEPYQNHNILGGSNLHNQAGLKHAVGMLYESRRTNSTNNIANATLRFNMNRDAMRSIIDWHDQNFDRIQQAHEASKNAAPIGRGLFEAQYGTDGPGPVVQPTPTGYVITPSDLSGPVQHALETHQIPHTRNGNDVIISTEHKYRYLIHYLFDYEAQEHLVIGRREYDYDGPVYPGVPIPRVAGYRYRDQGVTYDAEVITG